MGTFIQLRGLLGQGLGLVPGLDIYVFNQICFLGNLTTILETLRESAPKRATGGFITRCEFFLEMGLKCKFSISHDLVDDERFFKYMKEIEKVSKKPNLETVIEERVSN